MTVTGKNGLQEFEVGKIYKGVEQNGHTTWTTEFVPLADGSIFIIKHTRDDTESHGNIKILYDFTI